MEDQSNIKKKLISINIKEYKDVFNAIEKENKNNNGSIFVCEAVRFFLNNNPRFKADEYRIREIVKEELLTLLNSGTINVVNNHKDNIHDIINNGDFEDAFAEFEKFDQDE
ncbi:hypothetical protein [Sporosalibacterium faouarense]|uniref:hypothetical protein n=1 Tax=Sporosalibacterium faouarense TaxID=516123 RepID=UPI00192AEEB4|nr:hypothetical protein [Sporosalibacterium faouarense]